MGIEPMNLFLTKEVLYLLSYNSPSCVHSEKGGMRKRRLTSPIEQSLNHYNAIMLSRQSVLWTFQSRFLEG